MAINKVGSKGIEDGSVAAADFADNTITSGKLQDGAVTNAKLSNTTVTLSGTSIALGASGSVNNKFVDWQSVVVSDGSTVTTMVAGKGYFLNNTSAAGLVKLPTSASIGDFLVIKDYSASFGTNSLTIQRNGHNIQGVANDSLITTNRASLVLVYVDSTKGWLFTDEHNVADLQLSTFIAATGGTVATSGDYKIHTFTGDGCLVVSTIGAGPAGGPTTASYLVVAGGGGGSESDSGGAGGGGGGGYRNSFSTETSGGGGSSETELTFTGGTVYTITVGAGGTVSGLNTQTNGSNSSIIGTDVSITSTGGGKGASTTISAGSGGSGGGGGENSTSAGSGTANQGFSGGDAVTNQGGGGGGSGAAGVIGNSTGNGGAGLSSSITGSSVSRGGGGGSSGIVEQMELVVQEVGEMVVQVIHLTLHIHHQLLEQ